MISYLQIDRLTKSFGDLVLFENITFGVAQGQKIGLIAKNGSGKTTLLNIIAGKEDYDSGEVVFRKDLRVGYLEQSPSYPEDLTVLQACFYSTNETVQLIAAYEEALAQEDHARLEELLGADKKIIRIMPNTPVAIGEGMILCTANPLVTKAELAEFTDALEYAGICDMIPEEKIDAASVISGCGPAFMFMFVSAFEEAGKALGLDGEKARLYAGQTMLGAAGLALSSKETPEELKIKVCSPGGTTIEGVHSFEQNELSRIVLEAAQASYRRTLELAGK